MTNPVHRGALPNEWEQACICTDALPFMLPIVTDPDARISPNSKLKSVCKQPSIFNAAGEVVGLPRWTQHITTPDEFSGWRTHAAMGLGLRCGADSGFVGVDFDIEDEAMLTDCLQIIETLHPGTPVRRRESSAHAMALLRFCPQTLEDDLPYRKIKAKAGIVEFIGDGKQIMVFGTHASGSRVKWSGNPFRGPLWTLQELNQLFDEISRRYAVQTQTAVTRVRQKGARQTIADPVAEFLRRSEWFLSETADAINLRCPWEHEHTTGEAGNGSTQWFLAGTNGYDRGHFRCLHAHCQHRTEGDFFAAIGYAPVKSEDLTPITTTAAAGKEKEFEDTLRAYMDPKKGVIKGMLQTITAAIALETISGARFKFDNFTGSELISFDNGKNFDEVSDADISRLIIRCEKRIQPVRSEWVNRAVCLQALENVVDTGIDWLKSLPAWDGVNRLERFGADYLGAEDDNYAKEFGLYIFTAAVGRIMRPGIKADIMPVFVGAQGCGKSTAVMAMAPTPDTYREIDFGAKDDDLARRIRGAVICEANELNGLQGRALESIKAVITRQVECWTPKYKERQQTYQRRCIFIGTTNDQQFLTDPTGSRRFAGLNTGVTHAIDVDRIKADHAQLWAEGKFRFETEGILYARLEVLARERAKHFESEDPWTEITQAWLDAKREAGETPVIVMKDFLQEVIGVTASRLTRKDFNRMAACFRKLGLDKTTRKINGKDTKVWAER